MDRRDRQRPGLQPLRTNTRHLVLTILVNIRSALVVRSWNHAANTARPFPSPASIVLWIGPRDLFPGSRTTPNPSYAIAQWQGAGGPTITLLIATALIAAAGLIVAKRTAPLPALL